MTIGAALVHLWDITVQKHKAQMPNIIRKFCANKQFRFSVVSSPIDLTLYRKTV